MADNNTEPDFVIKNADEYEKVEGMKTRVWVVKTGMIAMLVFLSIFAAAVLWMWFQEPGDAGTSNSFINNLFSIFKVIIESGVK